MVRLTRQERHSARAMYPDEGERRIPLLRSDCERAPRPCPFVSCKWNLFLDVTAAGSITVNFPDLEPEGMPAERSCALDVADAGPHTLQEVGEIMNITRERIRQLEVIACGKAMRAAKNEGLEDFRFAHTSHATDQGEIE